MPNQNAQDRARWLNKVSGNQWCSLLHSTECTHSYRISWLDYTWTLESEAMDYRLNQPASTDAFSTASSRRLAVSKHARQLQTSGNALTILVHLH
ncbi:MAG: hypothetical protein LC737_03185, partial [Chloroflexi bacterium]|nr:hypothetical protein [Chloroflexota bacterium]